MFLCGDPLEGFWSVEEDLDWLPLYSCTCPFNSSRLWVFLYLSWWTNAQTPQLLASFMSAFGEGNGTLLQYSCLKNTMDGGAWKAAVHGIAQSWTRLSDFPFTFHFRALEKEMATHSSVLAWRIPGTGEPGGLPYMGLHRVGQDWSNLAASYLHCSGKKYQISLLILFWWD